MKKLISLILCFVLVMTAVPAIFMVSAETDGATVSFLECFTVTNDLSGRNGNFNNYCDYAEYGYVNRTPSILNPDGYSYKYTTSSTKGHSFPYVSAWSNFDNDIYADAVGTAKAVVAVISADINNTATAYPQNYEFIGIAQKELTSVTTAYHLKKDGSVYTYENYYADDYSDMHVSLDAGETAIFISTIPEGTDITQIDDCCANFHSKYNANKAEYEGNVYYIDSIGLISDVDTFVATIPSIAKPLTVAAWNVKGDAGARWTLDSLYADMGIASYHVNIFDSTGAFVKSVTTDKTEMSFAAVAGATYTVQIAGYDANGKCVTIPVNEKTTIRTTNYNTTASPAYGSYGGGFAKTTDVIRTANEHNPDGKSHQFTLSGGTGYGWFNVQSGYSATLTTGAIVWVISADEKNTSNYPFRINSTGTPSQGGMKFDVVSIAADGTVTTHLGISGKSFPAGSTNYVILRNTNGQYWSWEKSTWNPTVCLWSDALASNYSSTESPLIYYSDSIGYTEDPDALIKRLTSTETVSSYFEPTKDTFGSGSYWSSYNEHGLVTNRPVTAHNPDGNSFKIATNLTGTWNYADFYKCYNGVGEAIVMVISVDETNVSEYPMHIGINGQNKQSFTLVTFDTENNITVENVATIHTKAGYMYYAIISIADIPVERNFHNPNSTLRIWTDYGMAEKYDSCFYVDAIGVASNADNLVASLKAGKVLSDITFDNTELTVPEGNDISLSGNIISGLILDKSYSTSNPDVVAVDGESFATVGSGVAYVSLVVDGYTDYAACKINVIPVEVGDVNYDGEINVLDLIRIKKYLAETTDDIAKKGADCSLNNSIDADDMVSIRQLLLGVQKKNSDIGFGFYGARLSSHTAYADTAEMLKNGTANTFFAQEEYSLKQLTLNGGGAWVGVYSIYSDASEAETDEDTAAWQAKFDTLVSNLKATGYYGAVDGWYLDEPTDHEAVLAVSKYAQKYGKRFFVCYLAASVAPDNKTINPNGIYDSVGINEENTKYVTDIAYDLYWTPSEMRELYESINASMHSLLGVNTPKIWYIAYTAFYSDVFDLTDQELAEDCQKRIADMNVMYDFLKSEKNKGGLLCYSYDNNSSTAQYGLYNVNQVTNGAYNALFERIGEIGKEICSGTLD